MLINRLFKEAICSSVKVGDNSLVIGILEYLQVFLCVQANKQTKTKNYKKSPKS